MEQQALDSDRLSMSPQCNNLAGVEYHTIAHTNYEYVKKGEGDASRKMKNKREPGSEGAGGS